MSNIQQGINSALATTAIGAKLAGANELALQQGAKRSMKGLKDIQENLHQGKMERYSKIQKDDLKARVADLNHQYQNYRTGRRTPGMPTGSEYADMMKDIESYFDESKMKQGNERAGTEAGNMDKQKEDFDLRKDIVKGKVPMPDVKDFMRLKDSQVNPESNYMNKGLAEFEPRDEYGLTKEERLTAEVSEDPLTDLKDPKFDKYIMGEKFPKFLKAYKAGELDLETHKRFSNLINKEAGIDSSKLSNLNAALAKNTRSRMFEKDPAKLKKLEEEKSKLLDERDKAVEEEDKLQLDYLKKKYGGGK